MRDYLKDKDFQNIKAIKEESKQKVEIFAKPLQFKNKDHKFLGEKWRKLQADHNDEMDKREKKTIARKIRELKPYIDRYNEIKRSNSLSSHKKSNETLLNLLQDVRGVYTGLECIDSNPENYNNAYDDWLEENRFMDINGNIIFVNDIKEFAFKIQLISDLFGIDVYNKSIKHVILSRFHMFDLFEGDLPMEYDCYINEWKIKCAKIDDAVTYLRKSRYINKSKEEALKVVTNEDAKWLLESLMKYKTRHNKTISILKYSKNYRIKAIILYQYFKKIFTLQMATKITQYSRFALAKK